MKEEIKRFWHLDQGKTEDNKESPRETKAKQHNQEIKARLIKNKINRVVDLEKKRIQDERRQKRAEERRRRWQELKIFKAK
jgi:hypothetical protein